VGNFCFNEAILTLEARQFFWCIPVVMIFHLVLTLAVYPRNIMLYTTLLGAIYIITCYLHIFMIMNCAAAPDTAAYLPTDLWQPLLTSMGTSQPALLKR
jgi:hypothetical protein